MANAIQLEVATPNGLALQTEVEIVTAPSVAGEFGVLPGHLPLLAATQAGVLKYREGGKFKVAAVGYGFVEAGPEKLLMLTDDYQTVDQIDRAEAEKELAEAERRLAEFDGPAESGEHQELERDLLWARARVEAVTAAA